MLPPPTLNTKMAFWYLNSTSTLIVGEQPMYLTHTRGSDAFPAAPLSETRASTPPKVLPPTSGITCGTIIVRALWPVKCGGSMPSAIEPFRNCNGNGGGGRKTLPGPRSGGGGGEFNWGFA